MSFSPSWKLLRQQRISKNDYRRFSPIAHRDRAASRTHARPRRIVVGCEGRLGTSPRVCSTGRRRRGVVGARLPPPQGRRSGQRNILVWSGGQARLQRRTRCGMAEHRERFAGIDRPLALVSASLHQAGGISGGKQLWFATRCYGNLTGTENCSARLSLASQSSPSAVGHLLSGNLKCNS